MILRLGVVWRKLWLSFEMIPYHGFLWYRSVELPKYFFPVLGFQFIFYTCICIRRYKVWIEGNVDMCIFVLDLSRTGPILFIVWHQNYWFFAFLRFVMFTVCHLPSLKKKTPGQTIIIFYSFYQPFSWLSIIFYS